MRQEYGIRGQGLTIILIGHQNLILFLSSFSAEDPTALQKGATKGMSSGLSSPVAAAPAASAPIAAPVWPTSLS